MEENHLPSYLWRGYVIFLEYESCDQLGENTLRKTNVAPKNRPSQKERIFQSSIFRSYVSFSREGIFAPAVLRHKKGLRFKVHASAEGPRLPQVPGGIELFLRIRPIKTPKLLVGEKFPPSMKKMKIPGWQIMFDQMAIEHWQFH